MLSLRIYFGALLMMLSCENNVASEISENAAAGYTEIEQRNVIVGEWEQLYTCYDENRNNKLDAAEKKPSGSKLGFNWFLFREDGSCLRDKDIKFKGTYEIKEETGKKRLVIHGGDNLRYAILELTGTELTLQAGGAFLVFRRVG